MLEVLEALLIDYMQNFKNLGIPDQNGHPFDPEHFDFKNPEHFAKLRAFNIDIAGADKVEHSSLPFYDPACDGIAENAELQPILAEATRTGKWVDATRHEYPLNACKALWNYTFTMLSQLKRITDPQQKWDAYTLLSLPAQIYSVRKEASIIKVYLDNTRVTEPEAEALGIHYYLIPQVVDKRTLAFAKSLLKAMNHVMSLRDPFGALSTFLYSVAPKSFHPTIKEFLDKSVVVMKIAQPRLTERVACYEARLTGHLQTDEQREALVLKMDELRERAIELRHTLPFNLLDIIEHSLGFLSQNFQIPIETRLAELAKHREQLDKTLFLLGLKPVYRFKKNYAKELFQRTKPQSDLILRADAMAKEECQTTLMHLFPNKSIQQIAEEREQLKAKINQLERNLTLVLQAEKDNDIDFKTQLLLEKTALERECSQKQLQLEQSENELREYDQTQAALSTRANSRQSEEPATPTKEQRNAPSTSSENSSLLGSLASGISSSFTSFWGSSTPSTEAPKPDNRSYFSGLSVPNISSLWGSSASSSETPQEAPVDKRAIITDRIAQFSTEIEDLRTQIASKNASLNRTNANIDAKTKEFESRIQECLERLELTIKNTQNEIANLQKSRWLDMDTFKQKIEQFERELKSIKCDYDGIKQANNNRYESETLRNLCAQFELRYASFPLCNSDIQDAIDLLIKDFEKRNLRAISNLSKARLWNQNRKSRLYAKGFLNLIKTFTDSPTTQGKLRAIVLFKRISDKLTLPKNTSIVTGIIIGAVVAIAITGLLISGWGILFAAGATAIFTATIITKIIAAATLYILAVLGISIGSAIGESATPIISENYQKLGLFCSNAAKTLESQTDLLTAKNPEEASKSIKLLTASEANMGKSPEAAEHKNLQSDSTQISRDVPVF